MGGPTRYNLSSANLLKNALNETLIRQFAAKKIYKSRWLTILIGLSKIINSTALMGIYMWAVPWEVKYFWMIAFVVFSLLTYLVEYGISIFWWPNYMGTFYRLENDQKFIVCANTPFYSGDYHVIIYPTNSLSYFQKLKKPIIEKTYNYSKYFTQSGYLVENEWIEECNSLISKSMNYKSE